MTLTEIRDAIAALLTLAHEAGAQDKDTQEIMRLGASVAYEHYERLTAHGAQLALDTARGIASPPNQVETVRGALEALNVRAQTLIDTRAAYAAQFNNWASEAARTLAKLRTLESEAVFEASMAQLKAPNGKQQ